MDDAFDSFRRHGRQAALREDGVHAAHPCERTARGGEWKIRTEEHFGLRAIFYEEPHRVVELPGTVVERGEIGEDVRMPSNHRDGLAFPRMPEMREHHAQFGEVHCHRVEMGWTRVVEQRAANERRARVKEDGQSVLFAISVDVATTRVARMHALIE